MAREQELLKQLPQLPPDVLPKVLAFVPLQQRLSSCSLASRSMRAAAAAATHEIQLPTLRHQATADALCAWLQQHGGQAVTRLEIKAPYYLGEDVSDRHVVQLPLPWQQLNQVQDVGLEGGPGLLLGLQGTTAARLSPQQQQQQQQQPAAAGSSKGIMTRRGAAAAAEAAAAAAAAAAEGCIGASLGALTALTSLQISCTLPISYSVTRWVTSQLQHLTLLRSLELGSMSRASSSMLEYPAEDNAALGDVLGQLVLLTRLEVSMDVDGRALAAASNLQQLQELRIAHVGSTEQPLKLQNLPCSLTNLCLDQGVLNSTIDSSWEMPELQQLAVSEWEGRGFKPEVLARMPQLRQLDVSMETLKEDWGISDLTAVLPQLQQLQRLELYGMQSWPEVEAASAAWEAAGTAATCAALNAAAAAAAASCAGLTASTQLTALQLQDCWLPVGPLSHMFPASRLLPFLQVLDVSCSEDYLQELEFHTDDDDTDDIRRRSLQLKPRQLAQVVGCCPNLQELSTLWADGGMGPSEMQQLLTLSKLTRLGVAGCDWDDEAAGRALAQLTGLQELRIMAASKLTAGGLACLTALKRLSYLAVWGSKLSFSDKSNSTTGSRNSDSEDGSKAAEYQDVTLTNRGSFLPVQLQLLKKCRSSFQGLSVMCEHAQQQAELRGWELARTEETLRLQNAHLQAVQQQLVDTQQQLASSQRELQAARQQLQQQGQQPPTGSTEVLLG